MRIALANPDHFDTVLGLIEEAAAWLRTKDTNQWSAPWPDQPERDARVRRGLAGGKTWIVWDEDIAAATVTLAAQRNPMVWGGAACQCDLSERAVFAHRLITARSHQGQGLGAQLIDWAGLRARNEYGARWIRIDVWTTNAALHDYYQGIGFEPCGYCENPDYPSGKLFQKRTARIETADSPLFDQPVRELVSV
ncbi:MAG TPA: GNAT family N-acetyltransferase [Streptosporangiaceae bacterium]